MGFFLIILVIPLICFIMIKFWKKNSKKIRKVLPGPSLLESLKGFKKQGDAIHLLFTDWAKKYGNIFECNLGPKKIIVLNDHTTIKEAFSNPMIQGRPEIAPINPFRQPKNGIVRNEGESWILQRKLTMRHLRHFGFGNGGIMEKLIVDEVLELCQNLSINGTPHHTETCVHQLFFFPAMNTIWIVMAGYRLGNGERDQEMKKLFVDFFDSINGTLKNPLVAFIPKFVDFFPWIPSWSKYTEVSRRMRRFLQDILDDHKNRLPNESVGDSSDFIFAYLRENCLMDSQKKLFDEEALTQLEFILMDFIFAGFETISNSMEWLIFDLVRHPKCQKKLRTQLDHVIGKNGRLPTIGDRPNLPYLEACILESLRLSPTASVGVMHEVTAATEISGYDLEKGDMVIGNLYRASRDPDVMTDPDLFVPERFLNDQGTAVQVPPYFLPFSCGKRTCLGMAMAKDSMFLLAAAIFTKFEVIATGPNLEFGTSPRGLLLTPKKFWVHFNSR